MRFVLVSVTLLLFTAAGAQATEAQLKEGNRLFRRGNYSEALKKYNDALIDSPNSAVLRFNAGAAAYQSGDAAAAEKLFRETGDQTAVPQLRSAARYNQGNALFRQGQWQAAIDAYKDSLRSNPADEDAKYNLGVALNALKNPPKQQPQQGQGKNDKQKQDKSKPNEMSREDAERLLSAAGASEKKKPQNKAAAGAGQPDEDW